MSKKKFGIVSREDWNADPPKSTEPLKTPVHMLIMLDTASEECYFEEECLKSVQQLQKQYMEKGFDDIPWNFIVGGDGRVYEGRGFKYNPIKTDLTNQVLAENDGKSLDIAYIGDYRKKYPKFKMQFGFGNIVQVAISEGYLIQAHDMKLLVKKKSIKGRFIKDF